MAQRPSVDILTHYPVTAMVGCDHIIEAMACALCSPDIRTVLVCGPAGTGKTVAVRGAAAIAGDRKSIELPLNATPEQVFGTIDLDDAISEGRRTVADSVMKRADGNILVADNINLLPKGLTHSILNAVTTGLVRAELDGVSVEEKCNTVLLATMDPAEAELTPHELDRFDICVYTRTHPDEVGRRLILKRNLEHSASPRAFHESYSSGQEALAERISSANPAGVRFPEELMALVPGIVEAMDVRGHRGDVALANTACALAALRGMAEVDADCLRDAVTMCLIHRAGTMPEQTSVAPETVVEIVDTEIRKQDVPDSESQKDGGEARMVRVERGEAHARASVTYAPPPEQEDVVFAVGQTFRVTDFLPRDRELGRDRDSGRRGLTLSKDTNGRCIGYVIPHGKPRDIALGATIRMAAPHQTHRARDGVAIAIEDDDIREKVRVRRKGTKILFVVDGSGSMGAESRMVAVKGTILSILEEAYRRRDMVGLVVFRGEQAEEVLPMTRSVSTARSLLESMPVGGRTPLVSGLQTGYGILKRYADKGDDPVMVLLTDGWGNVGRDLRLRTDDELRLTSEAVVNAGIRSVVIDTEPLGSKLRRASKLARMLRADCLTLEEMNADCLSAAVMTSLMSMEPAAKDGNTP